MNYKDTYNDWLQNPYFDAATKEELRAIADDEKEIEDRFYRQLEFGTGGLRGVIGAGTNRMNIYTVGAATQGFSNYINKMFPHEKKAVCIGHDCRHNSRSFQKQPPIFSRPTGYTFTCSKTCAPHPKCHLLSGI